MKKINLLTISVLMLLYVFLTSGSVSAAISTHLEIRGQIANETAGIRNYLNLSSGFVSWGPQNFAGFYYDAGDELGNENLTLMPTLTAGAPGRTIAENNLSYSTRGDAKQLKVVEEAFNGDAAAAAAAGLTGFGTGDMSAVAGSYKIVGWQAEKYVALKNKTNKLVRLILEHGPIYEKQLLFAGDSWDVGGGWRLTARSIDIHASPRQTLLVLSKDGVKKDEKVIFEKRIYTYVENSLGGETDVPAFVTFVDGILPSETTDVVVLRYTWVIDTNVTEVKVGDQFGVFEVREANMDRIRMDTNRPLTLSQDSTIDLTWDHPMGSMKFKVVDSPTLRFYPIVEYEAKTESISPSVSAIKSAPSETSPGATTPGEIPIAVTMPKGTPGFEVVIATVAFGAISIFKRKRR